MAIRVDARAALDNGAPFFSLLRRLHLLRPDGRPIARPALAAIAVTWVPLVVLAAIAPRGAALLKDFSVHARLLIAIPLLFEADVLLHDLGLIAVERFAEDRITGGESLDAIPATVTRAGRLRNSAWAELVCLALGIVVGQLSVWGFGPNPLALREGARAPLSPELVWFGFVSLPIFGFLVYRWLWRWLVWSWVLWRFSRLDLRLIATHPDACGGLSVLAIPTRAFALFLAAIAVNVAGAWATQVTFAGASLRSFAFPFGIFVALGLVLGLGPLMAFSGKLARARIVGRVKYDTLACSYVTQFDERWFVGGRKEGLLGSADIQALADLGNSYAAVRRMRVAPIDRSDIVLLVAAQLLPMVPLLLTAVPLDAFFKLIAKALF